MHKNYTIRKAIEEGIAIDVVILHKDLPESRSLELEVEEILKWGRRDIDTECLTNMTNGGEGVSGYIPTKEAIAKRLASMEGYKHSESTKEKMSVSASKPKTEEHSKNISIGKTKFFQIPGNLEAHVESVKASCSTIEFSKKMADIKNSMSEETKNRISSQISSKMLGANNPMSGKKPWDHPIVMKSDAITKLWSNADLFHSSFKDRGNGYGFTTLKKRLELEGVCHGSLIDKFKSGWEPQNDESWVKWKSLRQSA